jgi:hypothetical protein
MKNLTIGLVLLNLLTLFSCRTVLYTHEEVIDRYKTKPDVAKRFGNPNEKMISETSEAWLYVYRSNHFHHTQEQSLAASTATVTAFGKYDRFVIYRFDKQGNVVQWKAEGVDLTERKVSPGLTIALVAGLSAVFIGLLVIISNSLSFNFTGGH